MLSNGRIFACYPAEALEASSKVVILYYFTTFYYLCYPMGAFFHVIQWKYFLCFLMSVYLSYPSCHCRMVFFLIILNRFSVRKELNWFVGIRRDKQTFQNSEFHFPISPFEFQQKSTNQLVRSTNFEENLKESSKAHQLDNENPQISEKTQMNFLNQIFLSNYQLGIWPLVSKI